MVAKVEGEQIAVWLDESTGRPTRAVRQGRRFRVIDTPTPLDGADGWRFTARSDDGTTRIFDVTCDDGRWWLLHVWH